MIVAAVAVLVPAGAAGEERDVRPHLRRHPHDRAESGAGGIRQIRLQRVCPADSVAVAKEQSQRAPGLSAVGEGN